MKKMFTQINIVVFILLVFTLSACSNNGNTPIPVEQINYYEGSEGLVFSFLPNNPPEKVYPGQIYPITLEIENKGAFDVFGEENIPIDDRIHAEVNIVYDNLYFAKSGDYQGRESSDEIVLMGKSVTWPFGETKMQIVDIVEAQPLGQRSGAETTISASLCFPYETLLTQEICIDKDPYDNDDNQVACNAEDISLSDQGAPIAVTYVDFESTYLPSANDEGYPLMRPLFILSLRNVGSGQLVRPRSSYDEQKLCVRPPGDETPANAVGIEARIGNLDLVCTPEYPIFYNGESEVVCSLPASESIPVEANYKELLFVTLMYVYQVREDVTVEVDDSAGHLKPVTILDYRCSDFNYEYEDCRAFAQTFGTREFDEQNDYNLDCYFCDTNNRCLNSVQQSECPDALPGDAGRDEETRRFVGPCPSGEPSVSASFNKETNKVEFKCSDPSKVKSIDHHRCGCGQINYYVHESTEVNCVDQGLTGNPHLLEDTTRSEFFAVYDLDDTQINKLKTEDGSFSICYQGQTVDGSRKTDVKKYTVKG